MAGQCKCLKRSGERGRNRTFNLLIKSQLLCQLSYAPTAGKLVVGQFVIVAFLAAKAGVTRYYIYTSYRGNLWRAEAAERLETKTRPCSAAFDRATSRQD